VQETLRQSEQKFRRLYESMMDAFVITDMEGRIQESNLVMNACDAMSGRPQNDRQLKICTGLTGDNFVHISVADRGTGIPPEQLEHVFNPFYTTKPNGMGLGLAVCRTIVEAHAGKLWAANNPERGSTFHVIFPAGGRERGGI
jgi:signal transduction histidine kinase